MTSYTGPGRRQGCNAQRCLDASRQGRCIVHGPECALIESANKKSPSNTWTIRHQLIWRQPWRLRYSASIKLKNDPSNNLANNNKVDPRKHIRHLWSLEFYARNHLPYRYILYLYGSKCKLFLHWNQVISTASRIHSDIKPGLQVTRVFLLISVDDKLSGWQLFSRKEKSIQLSFESTFGFLLFIFID